MRSLRFGILLLAGFTLLPGNLFGSQIDHSRRLAGPQASKQSGAAPPPLFEAPWLKPQEGNFSVRDFHFSSGEKLPEINLHYITIGTPQRDAEGHVTNAVLLLHGTGGTGKQFLVAHFAGVLFGPGQLLDVSKY